MYILLYLSHFITVTIIKQECQVCTHTNYQVSLRSHGSFVKVKTGEQCVKGKSLDTVLSEKQVVHIR